MLKIKFETENDAFQDTPAEMAAEVRRILEQICDDIEAGETRDAIMDANGNTVGDWRLADC